MRYFIAFPFTGIINSKTKIIDADIKNFLTNLRVAIIENGNEVFLAHFRENWGKDIMTANECTLDDYHEMEKADVVLAFPGNPISGGVHIELGWASALNKKIFLFLDESIKYSPLMYGLSTITDTNVFFYKNIHDEKLYNILNGLIKQVHIEQ